MENLTEQLEMLLKSKQKLDADKAANLLLQYCQKANGFEIVTDYIMRFPTHVCESFCNNYLTFFDLAAWTSFFEALKVNEAFAVNASNSAVWRGFILFAALCKFPDTASLAHKIFREVLKIAEKHGKLPKKVGELFKKLVWDSIGETFLDVDISSWEDKERQRMMSCLCQAFETDEGIPPKVEMWMKKYDIVTPKAEAPDTAKPGKQAKATETAKEAAAILKTLQSAHTEASLLIDTLHRENGSIQNLEKELQNKTRLLAESYRELETKERHIKELSEQLKNFDERLKNSFHIDEIAKNQELAVLKNNLSSALKRQYNDFLENKDAPCTEENYKVFMMSLEHIFRTMKNCDIQLD